MENPTRPVYTRTSFTEILPDARQSPWSLSSSSPTSPSKSSWAADAGGSNPVRQQQCQAFSNHRHPCATTCRLLCRHCRIAFMAMQQPSLLLCVGPIDLVDAVAHVAVHVLQGRDHKPAVLEAAGQYCSLAKHSTTVRQCFRSRRAQEHHIRPANWPSPLVLRPDAVKWPIVIGSPPVIQTVSILQGHSSSSGRSPEFKSTFKWPGLHA